MEDALKIFLSTLHFLRHVPKDIMNQLVPQEKILKGASGQFLVDSTLADLVNGKSDFMVEFVLAASSSCGITTGSSCYGFFLVIDGEHYLVNHLLITELSHPKKKSPGPNYMYLKAYAHIRWTSVTMRLWMIESRNCGANELLTTAVQKLNDKLAPEQFNHPILSCYLDTLASDKLRSLDNVESESLLLDKLHRLCRLPRELTGNRSSHLDEKILTSFFASVPYGRENSMKEASKIDEFRCKDGSDYLEVFLNKQLEDKYRDEFALAEKECEANVQRCMDELYGPAKLNGNRFHGSSSLKRPREEAVEELLELLSSTKETFDNAAALNLLPRDPAEDS